MKVLSQPASALPSIQFRMLGFLPLLFFLGQTIHYARINELGHMLWMCNIGNLVLALGLFASNTLAVRVAVLWMVPGLVVWFVYVVLTWGVFLSSTLAHVGGIIVGLIALKRYRMDQIAWFYALLWYFFVQLLSYLFTPTNLNVNLSHSIEPGWQGTFSAYWKFWLVLSLATAMILWLLGWVLIRIFPAKAQVASSQASRQTGGNIDSVVM